MLEVVAWLDNWLLSSNFHVVTLEIIKYTSGRGVKGRQEKKNKKRNPNHHKLFSLSIPHKTTAYVELKIAHGHIIKNCIIMCWHWRVYLILPGQLQLVIFDFGVPYLYISIGLTWAWKVKDSTISMPVLRNEINENQFNAIMSFPCMLGFWEPCQAVHDITYLWKTSALGDLTLIGQQG